MLDGIINLRAHFGPTYRYALEEGFTYWDDLCGVQMRCKWGHIFFPAGEGLLAVSVDGHPNIAGKIRRLSCCTPYQDGDFGELTSLFHPSDFAEVAKIIRPLKRRVISEDRKAELTKRLEDYRLSHRHAAQEGG